jgi:hypothetical protein
LLPPSLLASLASLVLLACGHRDPAADAELTIVLDSIAARGGVEVVALPVDPSSLTRAALMTPDSAERLDAAFQRRRDSLNRAALAFSGLDRRSSDYARRYDDFDHGALAAESLRAERDRLRRTHDGSRAPVPRAADSARAAAIRGATDGTRQARTARSSGSPVTLTLAPGRWWIGLQSMPTTAFRAATVVAGARDTLRLP